MNYAQTLTWMFSCLPMYQRQGAIAFKKDLTNILALSTQLKNPEKKFKTIHVAGTNGKGSTSHMIASVLQEAGYKVGLYTSPHLKDFRERIKINGTVVSEKEVVDFVKTNRPFLEKQKLSFFEMTVGLAFECFAKHQVDIAIIEVGLGGRLDSTNIINPVVSVITNIGLDHTQFLGETLPEIAFEKAGVIKKNTPVVVGEYQQEVFSVFEKQAKINTSKIYVANKNTQALYTTDLLGNYQKNNVKTALQTIKILQEKKYLINESHIVKGLQKVVQNTQLLGRWQVLQQQPKVICDTAHNKEGLTCVIAQLNQEEHTNLHVVLGVVDDKNLEGILPLFSEKATYYFCKPNIVRGLDAHILQQQCKKHNLKGEVYASVSQAYKKSLKSALPNDLIFVGGSTFVVAEIV